MQADGGEAVEVRKHEGLAEGTNEEDGRHGLRGCSEVGELVRMRSKRRRRGAVARRVVGGFQPLGTNRSGPAEPEACRPMAVKPLRCASRGGGMRADGGEAVEVRKHEGLAEGLGTWEQMKGTAAMVSEAVRR